jgi:hypothetical protein
LLQVHIQRRLLDRAEVRDVHGENRFQPRGEVLHQMEAVRDLLGFRRAPAGAFSIGPGTIPRHDLDAGMLLQPGREGVRLAVGQQGDPLPPFQVDQHGAVDVALAKRPIIDAENRRGQARRQGRRTDQSQQRVARGRNAEFPAEPGAGGTVPFPLGFQNCLYDFTNPVQASRFLGIHTSSTALTRQAVSVGSHSPGQRE